MTDIATDPTPPITRGPSVENGSGDLLVVPMFADTVPGPGTEWVMEQLGDWVEQYMADADFTGKTGQLLSLAGTGSLPYGRVIIVGLGDEVDAEGLRRAAAIPARYIEKYAHVVTTLHLVDIDGALDAVALGMRLGLYRFTAFKSKPDERKIESIVFAGRGKAPRRGEVIAQAVSYARDLVNRPAGSKPATWIADWADTALSAEGVDVEVWDEKKIAAERLGGLMAVNAGADNPARLVVASYGPKRPKKTLVLVGKGIVFDSGGLSIKPAAGMETMKTDMAGAAVVLSAMWAIAKLKIPRVRVIAITPLTENMTGGSAQRPGDVFTARNGKTVEVLNTDAEGRLVLADGLSLAAEMQPDLIVDAATLTGSAKVALGPDIAALFSNDDDAAAAVDAAAKRAGESMWRLPLEQSYRKKLDSPVADMKNIGDRWGGAITASLMLEEFVDGVPWVHLDIAGPARADGNTHYLKKGGTGFGARTLIALAEDMAG